MENERTNDFLDIQEIEIHTDRIQTPDVFITSGKDYKKDIPESSENENSNNISFEDFTNELNKWSN